MYDVRLSRRAQKDAVLIKRAGLNAKVKQLIEVLRLDPFASPPPFEKLVGDMAGFYSRRITVQHRLVYEVIPGAFENDGVHYEGIVRILRAWTHYER